MFPVLDNPIEIENQFESSKVLCMLLNPNIEIYMLKGLIEKRYVLETSVDPNESIKAMALGFYKEKLPAELTDEEAQTWNGNKDTEVKDILEELIEGETPYIILHKHLTRQQLDICSSVGRVKKVDYKGEKRFCLLCTYYNRADYTDIAPKVYNQGV